MVVSGQKHCGDVSEDLRYLVIRALLVRSVEYISHLATYALPNLTRCEDIGV